MKYEIGDFSIRPGYLMEAEKISEMINSAYSITDNWYKKEGNDKRVKPDGSTVTELMAEGAPGVVLVACSRDNKQLYGCVHAEWLSGDMGSIPGYPEHTKNYSFHLLSVPEKYAGHGIGKALVSTAEKMLKIRPDESVTCMIDIIATLGPRTRNLV